MDDLDGQRFSQRSLERLREHALFTFHQSEDALAEVVQELRILVENGAHTPDLAPVLELKLLDIEDMANDAASVDYFLLQNVQNFRREMAQLLAMDNEPVNTQQMTSFTDMFATERAQQQREDSQQQQQKRASRSSSGSRRTSATPKAAVAVPLPQPTPTPTPTPPQVQPQPQQRVQQATKAPRSQHATKAPRSQPLVAQQSVAAGKPAKSVPKTALTVSTSVTPEVVDISAEDDVPCDVCYERESLEKDPIVMCDACNTAVHQSCYQIAEVPAGDWYCRPCAQFQQLRQSTTAADVECVACCRKGGALVATIDKRYVHMCCALFLPELYVIKTPLGNLIAGVDKLGERRALRCCFCKRKDPGACAQCVVGKCVTAYHVRCGMRRGIKFDFMEDKGHFGSGCLTHQKKFLNSVVTDDEQSADDQPRNAGKKSKKNHVQAATSTSKTSTPAASPSKTQPTRKSSFSDSGSGSNSDSGSGSDSGSDSDSDDDSSGKDTPVEVATTPTQPTRALPTKPKAATPQDSRSAATPPSTSKLSKVQTKLNFGAASANTSPTPSPFARIVAKPAASTAPSVARPAAPPAPTAARGSTTDGFINRDVLRSQVFEPSFYPMSKPLPASEGDYTYVMITLTQLPLKMKLRQSPGGIKLELYADDTHNPIIKEALAKGVIHDRDEVFAFNDFVVRGVSMTAVAGEILPRLQMPIRCWIRTKAKKAVAAAPAATTAPASVVAPSPKPPLHTSLPSPSPSVTSTTPSKLFGSDGWTSPRVATSPKVVTTPTNQSPERVKRTDKTPEPSAPPTPETPKDKRRMLDTAKPEDGLSIDWPWLYLRSDGKVAMNLFWKAFDAGFFVRKINKRVQATLVANMTRALGFELTDEAWQPLLEMPRREQVPEYLVEFRKARKQKQTFPSSDIFVGVHTESLENETELQPLEVGTVVSVAKRTWKGINKLGGAGRVKKVNETTLPNGTKQFTYNIAYILGGNEKNVERKYITAVDLTKQTPTAREEEKEEAKQEEEVVDTSMINMRINMSLKRDKLVLLPPPPAPAVTGGEQQPHFQAQVLVAQGQVAFQRMDDTKTPVGPRMVLTDKQGEKTATTQDQLISSAFATRVKTLEENPVDMDEDEGEDTIRPQLEALQQQFAAVMEQNQRVFADVQAKIQTEYATKDYRVCELEEIRWKHYEQMYRDMVAARERFDDSDDENESDDEHENDASGTRRRAKREEPSDSEASEAEDETCGGIFVNKIKQEGNEVCVLCLLSGGDFAATACGKFVHPQCAMYTPETFFKDGIVHGIDQVPQERKSLTCSICHNRRGLSKIQCASKKCMTAFHIACGYINGLLTRDPYYTAWCPKHLKTSGMADKIELPKHLQTLEYREAREKEKRATYARKGRPLPGEPVDTAAAQVASTSTAPAARGGVRKRKLRVVDESASDDDDMEILDGMSGANSSERRCARRLAIDENEGDDDVEVVEVAPPQAVFSINDTVLVKAREWKGMNRPGGVARVKAVHRPQAAGGQHTYDVAYVLDNSKEKQVEAKYVSAYRAGGMPTSSTAGKKKQRRL